MPFATAVYGLRSAGQPDYTMNNVYRNSARHPKAFVSFFEIFGENYKCRHTCLLENNNSRALQDVLKTGELSTGELPIYLPEACCVL